MGLRLLGKASPDYRYLTPEEYPAHVSSSGQFLCTVTSVVSTISVVYGVGNHLSIIEKSGQLHNTLLFIWLSCFFFFLNIPVGKVAVSAMLVAFMGKTR